jgi:hypothetical protein
MTEQRLIETKGSEKRYRKTEAWSLTQKSRFLAGTSCGRNQAPFTLCISSEAAKHDTKSLTVPSHIGETRATQQHRSPGKQKARHFNICILGGQDVWRTVLESELTGNVGNRATRRSYRALWRPPTSWRYCERVSPLACYMGLEHLISQGF